MTTDNTQTGIVKPAIGGKDIVSGRKPKAASGGIVGLSRLVMYTGTGDDRKNYGTGFKPGEFLDDLSRESLGMSVRVAVVGSWATYARWSDVRGKPPIYQYDSWDDVPADRRGDFDGSTGPDGVWIPPVGTECINAVLLVEGHPESAYYYQFKKTGLQAWDDKKTGIERYESSPWSPCLYELSSKEATGRKGDTYNRLTSRMVVRLKPGDALYDAREWCVQQFADLRAQAQQAEDEAAAKAGGGYEPAGDDLPV